jgi:AmmeMemoRadiSam system protein B/AmmeMemoRadiSam system protein A
MLGLFEACNGQTHTNTMNKTNRQPAVAGKFYPSDAKELKTMLDSFFEGCKPLSDEQPAAIIVPHAGYVFSAGVAAKAVSQIDREARFDRIFVIGSSHTMHFEGVSVYTLGDFITPLGNVEVDDLAQELTDKYSFITNNPQPHIAEHSLEVQLPLLQYWLKKPFKIVPIIIGGSSEKTSKKLAEALEPYFGANNLFVISTDFSHYPQYADATMCDKAMADAIIANSSQTFLDTKHLLEGKNIDNLATVTCGWTSVLSLLYITEKKKDISIKKIDYKNSGDSRYGGRDQVVGYNALCVYQKNNNAMQLTKDDKQQLLALARKTIVNYVTNKDVERLEGANFSASASEHAGAFVTLRKNGSLRGCIGTFYPDGPLYKTIQTMAISSATRDTRFDPVSPEELSSIDIEISVLTPMKKIKTIDEIILGKHGIYIQKEGHSGTFLPQVATETGWTKEEFLGHCARDKAFIGWDGWRNADIYIYESIVFEEKE